MFTTGTYRRLDEAVELMQGFAARTGLTSDRPAQRYLWTDAFAVCNYLALARITGGGQYGDLARQLIDQVHHTLGRHRGDDGRVGWLSGLEEHEGAAHPTRAGLRIGKPLPERLPGEPLDERLEWERDGQYFHYLTRWMHALDQTARATGEPRYNLWARELAHTAWAGFSRPSATGEGERLAWKMSIDLSRPLLPSMGQHDPLDGFITYAQLETTARELPSKLGPPLDRELASLASLASGTDWVTYDALGIGGLLVDAARVAQLSGRGLLSNGGLLRAMLAAAVEGLTHTAVVQLQQGPAGRLAFRELGLSIGLRALATIQERVLEAPHCFAQVAGVRSALEALSAFAPVGATIESFWLDDQHRGGSGWQGNRDINEVMLATALVPDGLLSLPQVESVGASAWQ